MGELRDFRGPSLRHVVSQPGSARGGAPLMAVNSLVKLLKCGGRGQLHREVVPHRLDVRDIR